MSRGVVGLDRFLALLAGLVLVVVGVAVAAWPLGYLKQVWPAMPDELRLQTAGDVVGASWWPWAAGGAGVVLALLALWWLLAHVPRRGAGDLSLPGSDRAGRLMVDADAPASAAADVLADAPGVRSARGRTIRDRNQLVVELTVVTEPDADLDAVVSASDAVVADLARVLGRPDARARVQITVARRGRSGSRVH
ncbi:hypothetical protein ACFFKU_14050 [Kineococcus gynurae]|uniref:Alkaline shock response membrane anchor protein AmaP n=1 Tax=Kineococcus gynurae TaxID=452979 RepID=A0ABV5LU29_9ACTN